MAQQQGSATERLYVAREYYRAFAFGITDGKMYISPENRIHIW